MLDLVRTAENYDVILAASRNLGAAVEPGAEVIDERERKTGASHSYARSRTVKPEGKNDVQTTLRSLQIRPRTPRWPRYGALLPVRVEADQVIEEKSLSVWLWVCPCWDMLGIRQRNYLMAADLGQGALATSRTTSARSDFAPDSSSMDFYLIDRSTNVFEYG